MDKHIVIKPISFNSKKKESNSLLYTICINLKSITLRGKKSDTKASYCMINLYEGLGKGKPPRTKRSDGGWETQREA